MGCGPVWFALSGLIIRPRSSTFWAKMASLCCRRRTVTVNGPVTANVHFTSFPDEFSGRSSSETRGIQTSRRPATHRTPDQVSTIGRRWVHVLRQYLKHMRKRKRWSDFGRTLMLCKARAFPYVGKAKIKASERPWGSIDISPLGSEDDDL